MDVECTLMSLHHSDDLDACCCVRCVCVDLLYRVLLFNVGYSVSADSECVGCSVGTAI